MPSRFLLSDSPPPSVGGGHDEQKIFMEFLVLFMFSLCVFFLIVSLVRCCIDKSVPPVGPENPVNPRPGPVRGHRSHPRAGAGNGASLRQEAAAVRVHQPQQPREVAPVLVQHHDSRATALLGSGLPTELFSEKTRLRLRGVEEGCVICLSGFESGEGLTILPKCNHGFHIMCIERWWKEFHSCPTCRTMY